MKGATIENPITHSPCAERSVPYLETATSGTLPTKLERSLQSIGSSKCPHENPASVAI